MRKVLHIGDEMEINKIRELALANGFSLKEQASGNMDLHSYVYEFANALLKEATPEGFVLEPTKNVKYFSNDGENYEIHNTIEEAKKEAESAIEWFSEQLADQQLDPECDGNFHQVGYGIILGESSYSIDHVVTQEDVDKGNYSYEVGTQIMSLFLVEAQEQSHD